MQMPGPVEVCHSGAEGRDAWRGRYLLVQTFGPVALATFCVSNGNDQDDLFFLLINDGKWKRAEKCGGACSSCMGDRVVGSSEFS